MGDEPGIHAVHRGGIRERAELVEHAAGQGHRDRRGLRHELLRQRIGRRQQLVLLVEAAHEAAFNAVLRAVTNARRLQAMTRDVLDTESIEAGRLGYAFQRVDLGSELHTAIEGFGTTHPVTLVPPTGPITLDADPDRLQQVLSNLLENAVKNSPATEPIVIETEASDGMVRVSVIDRGPGVDADSLERIFDKFVRGNPNAVSGTGLGLYIVRRIVEAHHGRIWCESAPGTPTAFVFELPVVQPDKALLAAAR